MVLNPEERVHQPGLMVLNPEERVHRTLNPAQGLERGRNGGEVKVMSYMWV
jgi:hypothetical protein